MQTENTRTEMNASPAPVKRTPRPLNGVDTPTLFATIGAVKAQRELAAFQFRASSRWMQGTHCRSRTESFRGAGGEHEHRLVTEIDADHPAVLCGADNGPTPVELLLHGLAACLTAGIANIAAARGVELSEVTSVVEGDIDLQGLLGIDEGVRNGFQGIRIRFDIKGDAPAAKLHEIVEQSRRRSAVFDVLTHGTPVAIDVVVD